VQATDVCNISPNTYGLSTWSLSMYLRCPCTYGVQNFEVVARFFGIFCEPLAYVTNMRLCFDSYVHAYGYRLKMACREPEHVALIPIW
jgi:hypothetical protein